MSDKLQEELSSGAVVYFLKDNKPIYLIEKMVQGHYAMVKGHLEDGESLMECALREIYEECHLNVVLDISFKREVSYYPYPDIFKRVIYFIAETKTIDTIAQKEEVLEIYFLPYAEAYNLLSYENDKEVLKAANEYLLNH